MSHIGEAYFTASVPSSTSLGVGIRPVPEPLAGAYLNVRLTNGSAFYNAGGVNVSGGGVLTADQGVPNTLGNAWPVKPTDGTGIFGTLGYPTHVLISSGGAAVSVVDHGPGPSLRVSTSSGSLTGLMVGGQHVSSANPVPVSGTVGVTLNGTAVSTANPLPVSGGLTDSQLSARLNTLGQKAMAASTPVVLASNQSSIPVHGQLTSSIRDIVSAQIPDGNSFSGTLDPYQTLTGSWELMDAISAVSVLVNAGASSLTDGATVQFSDDGHNPRYSSSQTIFGGVAAVYSFPRYGRYIRILYANGPANSSIVGQVIYHGTAITNPQLPLGAAITDLNNAVVSRAFITGRQPTGQWTSVAVTSAGAVQVTGTVRVDNHPTTVTTLSGSVTALLIGGLPASDANRLPITGTIRVENPSVGVLVDGAAVSNGNPLPVTGGLALEATQTLLRTLLTQISSSLRLPSSGTTTALTASLTSQLLLAENPNRRGGTIVNDSGIGTLRVKFGATASSTSYTYSLSPGATLELPYPAYTGRIDVIWTVASGNAIATETT